MIFEGILTLHLAVAKPGFPRREGGLQLLRLGQNPIIWQDNCQDLHKNERNWTETGCTHPWRPFGFASVQEFVIS